MYINIELMSFMKMDNSIFVDNIIKNYAKCVITQVRRIEGERKFFF